MLKVNNNNPTDVFVVLLMLTYIFYTFLVFLLLTFNK